MKNILLFSSIGFVLSFIFACSGQNVKQDKNVDENVGTIEEPGIGVKDPASMDFRVIDESLNTKWVQAVPEDKQLEVFSGEIAVHGNEPFTYIVLQVNKQDMYGLIGTNKFIEYLKTHQGHLTVAGQIESDDKQKWLKVSYVIQEGAK